MWPLRLPRQRNGILQLEDSDPKSLEILKRSRTSHPAGRPALVPFVAVSRTKWFEDDEAIMNLPVVSLRATREWMRADTQRCHEPHLVFNMRAKLDATGHCDGLVHNLG
jgi:hypothetical protein